MPRIAKWKEKNECVKPKLDPLQEDLKLKYTPITEQAAMEYLYGNKTKAFQMIEDIINQAANEWFEAKNLNDYVSF